MDDTLAKTSAKSSLAEAIRYTRTRWEALGRFPSADFDIEYEGDPALEGHAMPPGSGNPPPEGV